MVLDGIIPVVPELNPAVSSIDQQPPVCVGQSNAILSREAIVPSGKRFNGVVHPWQHLHAMGIDQPEMSVFPHPGQPISEWRGILVFQPGYPVACAIDETIVQPIGHYGAAFLKRQRVVIPGADNPLPPCIQVAILTADFYRGYPIGKMAGPLILEPSPTSPR